MKAPRRKVVGEIACIRTWSSYGIATLECGHKVTIGRYREKWAKSTLCTECKLLAEQEEKK